METKIPIAGISHGDINGIGYEVIIKSLMDQTIYDMCTPVIYGSPKVGAYHRKLLNIANFSFNNVRNVDEISLRKANIINCVSDNVRVDIGKSNEQGGEAAFQALERATNDLISGKIDFLVTAPIDKNNIQSDQFHFNGHTEYIKTRAKAEDVLMFLVSETFRIGVVTGHVPLKDVAGLITVKSILGKLRLMNQSLKIDFGIRKPLIAVLGLNPHAGDNSLIGTEEAEVIIPALKEAEKEGIMAFGPFPADGFFGSGSFSKFDGILAMYHDQGLLPFKSLSFDSGVNFTAGLPFIRTSPDHGTAFNIAGQGVASENSFRQALYLACTVYKNRQLHKEITANPLKQQEIDNQHDKADELPPETGNNE